MILSTAAAAAMNRGVSTNIFPGGIPPSYSWYPHGSGPIYPCSPPATWQQGQNYIHAFVPDGSPKPTPAGGANLLVRNAKFAIRRKSNKSWVELCDPTWPVQGGWFVNPITPTNASLPLAITAIGGGISKIQPPTYAYLSHFWPANRSDFGAKGIPATDIDGLFITWDVALDAPGRYCVGLSNDWWINKDGAPPNATDGFTGNQGSGAMDWADVHNVRDSSPTQNFFTMVYTNFTQAQLEESLPPYFAGNKNGDGFVNPGATVPPVVPPVTSPPAGSSVVLLAPAMTGTGALQGAWWNVWTNGQAGGKLNLAAGDYDVTVLAHGTPAGGVWPLMNLVVDNAVVGLAVTVGGPTDLRYTFRVPKLVAGVHDFEARFLNDGSDAAGGDRNLYLASITAAVVAVAPAPTQSRIDTVVAGKVAATCTVPFGTAYAVVKTDF